MTTNFAGVMWEELEKEDLEMLLTESKVRNEAKNGYCYVELKGGYYVKGYMYLGQLTIEDDAIICKIDKEEEKEHWNLMDELERMLAIKYELEGCWYVSRDQAIDIVKRCFNGYVIDREISTDDQELIFYISKDDKLIFKITNVGGRIVTDYVF